MNSVSAVGQCNHDMRTIIDNSSQLLDTSY